MKIRIKISCLLLTVLTVSMALATIPSGYYDDAAGLSGNDLRLALHNIIDGHNVKTYDQVWTAFATTDVLPEGTYGPEKIWCMYTGIDFDYNEDQQGNLTMDVYTTYNREHSWPKSWANESVPMLTDIFHLYPTQAYANSYRNNNEYGEVGTTVNYTTENGSKIGQARTGLGFVGTVFEPIDEYKGDLARTYFYMSTRYYTEDADWGTSGMTNKCELEDWAVSMLLNWHNDDPVSQKELDRVEAVYAIQYNRNPYIDHPEYVAAIWDEPAAAFGAPTAQSASSIQFDRFTANWSAVTEATGYKLYISLSSDFSSYISGYGPYDAGDVQSKIVSGLASSVSYYYRVVAYKVGEESGNSNIITVMTTAPIGSVDSTKVFISEYIEGSDVNKALEIYNNTGTDIDLGKITLKLYSNGATSASNTLTLSGTLINETVYVIANSSANASILAEADLTNNSVVNFNGNDVVEMYYDNSLIDRIGVIGNTADFAKDVTMVRKPEILQGNTTYTVSEWTSYASDETSYLGFHTVSEVPLSIALQSFKASYENGTVLLHWVTASETENAAFQIFRNDEFITSIEGAGTTSVTKYYEYIDKNIVPGRTYTYLLNDIDYSGTIHMHEAMSVTISIPSDGQILLPEGSIGAVYPNPFNPKAILPLTLDQDSDIRILLYDILGKKRKDILSGNFVKGDYSIPINATNLPSGAYVLHIQLGTNVETQKIILSK